MGHKLTAGAKAPHFRTVDVLGDKVDLAHYQAKYVLVIFLRYSGCPFCNLTIHRLALEYPLLKRNGCEVIAFIQSTGENIQRNIYDRHALRPPFPIIADQERKYYDLYGVTTSISAVVRSFTKIPDWVESVRHHGFKQAKLDGNIFLVPALFIIDSDTREIVKADYATSFYQYETFTSIYESLTFRLEPETEAAD